MCSVITPKLCVVVKTRQKHGSPFSDVLWKKQLMEKLISILIVSKNSHESRPYAELAVRQTDICHWITGIKHEDS